MNTLFIIRNPTPEFMPAADPCYAGCGKSVRYRGRSADPARACRSTAGMVLELRLLFSTAGMCGCIADMSGKLLSSRWVKLQGQIPSYSTMMWKSFTAALSCSCSPAHIKKRRLLVTLWMAAWTAIFSCVVNFDTTLPRFKYDEIVFLFLGSTLMSSKKELLFFRVRLNLRLCVVSRCAFIHSKWALPMRVMFCVAATRAKQCWTFSSSNPLSDMI